MEGNISVQVDEPNFHGSHTAASLKGESVSIESFPLSNQREGVAKVLPGVLVHCSASHIHLPRSLTWNVRGKRTSVRPNRRKPA